MVRDGKSIGPFSDVWIPGHYDTRLGSQPITDHQANTYLEEWIDQTGRTWKENSVRGAVSEQEAQQVLSVPIPLLPKSDELKWPHEKQGQFQRGRLIISSAIEMGMGRAGTTVQEEDNINNKTCGMQSGNPNHSQRSKCSPENLLLMCLMFGKCWPTGECMLRLHAPCAILMSQLNIWCGSVNGSRRSGKSFSGSEMWGMEAILCTSGCWGGVQSVFQIGHNHNYVGTSSSPRVGRYGKQGVHGLYTGRLRTQLEW